MTLPPTRLRSARALMLAMAACLFAGCQAVSAQPEMVGVDMTGIDHLADHLSVQDFQVNGRSGFQAGRGGRVACCVSVPLDAGSGYRLRITWNVTNWRDRTSEEREADVALERPEPQGRLYVHFLADGSVRALLSNYAPWAKDYPGPKGIPKKNPWDVYPWTSEPSKSAASTEKKP
jgi:Protein of unknown function (DUF3304)